VLLNLGTRAALRQSADFLTGIHSRKSQDPSIFLNQSLEREPGFVHIGIPVLTESYLHDVLAMRRMRERTGGEGCGEKQWEGIEMQLWQRSKLSKGKKSRVAGK